MTGSVVVIGAINVDLVVTGAPLPAPGQTVSGGVFEQHHGGKGGNQAVAAARALGGGPGVVIVGAVGNDVLGHDALDALRTEGVATSVAMRAGVRTGVALICVGPDGENQISVAPGANVELSAGSVTSAFAQVHEIGVVLASLEVSHAAVRAAAAWCSEHHVPFVLNPAPVQPWVEEVAALATYLTPNEHEREALGSLPDGVVVVETRGSDGAVIHQDGEEERVAAPRVRAVDTTGAEGVLYKQGAGHGGHVLFVQDGRLHYIYNFMGEDEQKLSAPDPLPLGDHVFGVRYHRTGTVGGSHTPLGDVSLYVDGSVVATTSGVRTHPASFGLSGGGVAVGRNTGQAVSSSYKAPYPFTGGTIAKVVVDISGTPYLDVERELAQAFSKD